MQLEYNKLIINEQFRYKMIEDSISFEALQMFDVDLIKSITNNNTGKHFFIIWQYIIFNFICNKLETKIV